MTLRGHKYLTIFYINIFHILSYFHLRISRAKLNYRIRGDELKQKYSLSLLSLNIRGINADTKRKAVFDWLKRQEAQIVYLQETYSTPRVEAQWKKDWGGEIFVFTWHKS